ncbi:hypothetical protein CBL_05102 [Carabus blaptoides fortunei]
MANRKRVIQPDIEFSARQSHPPIEVVQTTDESDITEVNTDTSAFQTEPLNLSTNSHESDSNENVTTRTLQQWALAAAAPFQTDDFAFQASPSWVKSFKKIHRIKQRKVTKYLSTNNKGMSDALSSTPRGDGGRFGLISGREVSSRQSATPWRLDLATRARDGAEICTLGLQHVETREKE